jgi:hypothetical protein
MNRIAVIQQIHFSNLVVDPYSVNQGSPSGAVHQKGGALTMPVDHARTPTGG